MNNYSEHEITHKQFESVVPVFLSTRIESVLEPIDASVSR